MSGLIFLDSPSKTEKLNWGEADFRTYIFGLSVNKETIWLYAELLVFLKIMMLLLLFFNNYDKIFNFVM